jgi:hypothetical protein
MCYYKSQSMKEFRKTGANRGCEWPGKIFRNRYNRESISTKPALKDPEEEGSMIVRHRAGLSLPVRPKPASKDT